MLHVSRDRLIVLATLGTGIAAACAGLASLRAAAALLGGVLGLWTGRWIGGVLRPLLHLSPPRERGRARRTVWFEMRAPARLDGD
jgi:hypothetical protein